VKTQAEALADDAAQYAAHYRVTIDEAVRRLQAQQESVKATDAIAREFASRLAGTASGLMGFLQMAVAALGTITVAALPHDSALGLIAVVGGFIAAALASGIVGVVLTPGGLTAGRQILRATGASPRENVAGNLRQVREDSA